MDKVNNKDTRMTPLVSYFTPRSSVFIVNFERVNANWEPSKLSFIRTKKNINKARSVSSSFASK